MMLKLLMMMMDFKSRFCRSSLVWFLDWTVPCVQPTEHKSFTAPRRVCNMTHHVCARYVM